MKKNFTLLVLLFVFIHSNSQSIEVGARGGYAYTWLSNNNVSNAGSEEDLVASFAYNYGLFLGYDINHRYSLEADVLYGTLTQNYKGKFIDNGILPEGTSYQTGETYTSQSLLYTISIPFLLQYNTRSGFYAELGPEYQFITDANYTATYSNPPANSNYNVLSEFAKSNIAAMLGLGWRLKIARPQGLLAFVNIRFEYGLTDMQGVDAFGQNLNVTSYNPIYSGAKPYYSNYQATHTLAASINAGLYYRFARHYKGNSPSSRGRVY